MLHIALGGNVKMTGGECNLRMKDLSPLYALNCDGEFKAYS